MPESENIIEETYWASAIAMLNREAYLRKNDRRWLSSLPSWKDIVGSTVNWAHNKLMVDPIEKLSHSLAQIHLSLSTYNCILENSKWKLSTTLWNGCRQKSQQWKIRRAKISSNVLAFLRMGTELLFVLSVKFLSCSGQGRLLRSRRKRLTEVNEILLFMLFLLPTPFKVETLNLKPLELPGPHWTNEPLESICNVVYVHFLGRD